jgi:hypothetical protein
MSNGASLVVLNGALIGGNGNGTFSQTGGSATISTLEVATNSGGTGVVNLSGGTLTVTSA